MAITERGYSVGVTTFEWGAKFVTVVSYLQLTSSGASSSPGRVQFARVSCELGFLFLGHDHDCSQMD